MAIRALLLAMLLAGTAQALTIDHARISATLVDGSSTDPFSLAVKLGGIRRFGAEPITVALGDLVATVPAYGLRPRGRALEWKGDGNGIRRITVRAGRWTLVVAGGGVELGAMLPPLTIAVRVGQEQACGTLGWKSRHSTAHSVRKVARGVPRACPGGPTVSDDPVPPTVQITSPTVEDGISFASSTITLGGVAFDDRGLAGITWSNDRGGGASVLPAESWVIPDVPLQPGDNVITVSAVDVGGNVSTDVLLATWNTNGIVFDGVAVAAPDAMFVAEVDEARVRQAIVPNPDLDTNSVRLVRILDGNNKVPVGAMNDDGNLETGDEIMSDFVYTGKIRLGGLRVGVQRYRVSARTLSRPDLIAWSPVMTFPIVEHVTADQLAAAIALANEARDRLAALRVQGTPTADALAQVTQLARDRGARAAGPSENGLGVWWVDASGLLGGVLGHDQATTRGGGAEHAPAPAAARPAAAPAERAVGAASAGGGPIGSRRVAVLAPSFYEDEADDIAAMLGAQQCPPFTVDTFAGPDAGAERWKSLEQYGLVVVAAHGDAFFQNVGDAYRDEWSWPAVGSQVVTVTGTTLSQDTLPTWERDLRLGRLAVLPDGAAAILPTFVSRYSGRFPASVVYAGSCRSTFNPTLANAFFGRGASTVYGYDGYVATSFANDRGIDLFTKLLAGKTTGEAFTPGLSDGDDTPASFVMKGRDDALALGSEAIVNAGFEHASGLAGSVPGWVVVGDGRVIGGLDTAEPTEGLHMGLISTGLGFTDSAGSIAQAVCLPPLPAGATRMTLSWDWNFFSEEFLEYCGSIYQDSFSVDLAGTQLQSTKVDDLCDSVTPTAVRFDKGGVYATGWRTTTADVTALAGTSGVLTFAAHDVGDSIYDSAILIDHVTLAVE